MPDVSIPAGPTNLGPGELTLGATGSLLDVSCRVNNAKIAPSKDQQDTTTKLCGTEVAGAVTYTFALSGNVDVDLAYSDGLAAFCWENAGTVVPFSFTPNTDAGAIATGSLVVDPLDFGGDDYGAPMTSDFEFTCEGKPTITWGTQTGTPITPLESSTAGGSASSSSAA